MTRDTVRQAANAILAVTQIAAGPLGPVLGFGSIADVSDLSRTFVTPASYAFAVWAPIYLTTLAYGVYQALPSHRADPLLCRVGPFTAVAFLASTLWVIAFPSEQFVLALAMMG